MYELVWNYFFTEKNLKKFHNFCTNFRKKIGTKEYVSNFVRGTLHNSDTISS